MVENPVLSERAIRDAAKSSVVVPQAVEDMERLMDAKIEALESRLVEVETQLTQAGPGVDTVKVVVAHLTEAPTNWHQSSVYFATLPSEHEDASCSSCVMLGDVMMVLGQCMALQGVFIATFIPTMLALRTCILALLSQAGAQLVYTRSI